MEKSILITGCSSGIGYDAAHGLKRAGWRVFATCRKEADCDRLRAEGLESFRLDYADEAMNMFTIEAMIRPIRPMIRNVPKPVRSRLVV